MEERDDRLPQARLRPITPAARLAVAGADAAIWAGHRLRAIGRTVRIGVTCGCVFAPVLIGAMLTSGRGYQHRYDGFDFATTNQALEQLRIDVEATQRIIEEMRRMPTWSYQPTLPDLEEAAMPQLQLGLDGELGRLQIEAVELAGLAEGYDPALAGRAAAAELQAELRALEASLPAALTPAPGIQAIDVEAEAAGASLGLRRQFPGHDLPPAP